MLRSPARPASDRRSTERVRAAPSKHRGAPRWGAPLAVLALVIGLAAACAPAAPPASPPAAPPAAAVAPASGSAPAATPAVEPATITFAYPALSLSWFPAYLADRKGFYADEQLTLETVQMVPTNAVAALLAGDAQFGVDLGAPAQATVQQGAPLRILMALTARPQHRLMVQPEIQQLADLRDKTLGVNQRGDLTDWEARVVLRRASVPPDEVNIIAIPSSPSRLAALASGQLAGAIMGSPFDLQAQAQGQHELGQISREIDLPFVGLATSQRLLAERPGLVQRTLRATLRGLEYTRAHPDEAQTILQKWLSVEPSVAAASFALGLETWAVDGTATDDAWLNLLEISRLAGPVPDGVTVDQFVAKGPLADARRQLSAR
jgi:NitT/TauT family transport system substrate-binding protein